MCILPGYGWEYSQHLGDEIRKAIHGAGVCFFLIARRSVMNITLSDMKMLRCYANINMDGMEINGNLDCFTEVYHLADNEDFTPVGL